MTGPPSLDWIWLVGAALSLAAALWVWRRPIGRAQKALWTVLLVIPILGPLFLLLAFDPPGAHRGASGPVDDEDPGRFS